MLVTTLCYMDYDNGEFGVIATYSSIERFEQVNTLNLSDDDIQRITGWEEIEIDRITYKISQTEIE